TLRRRVETRRMQPGFSISDIITNEGWRPEPLLLIYHTNFGWPLLDEDTRIVIPCGLERDERMGPPEDGAEETVTPIDAQTDEDGYVTLRVENARLGMGVSMKYRKADLPALGEWRSNASGDYVLGLEPGLCGVEGRAELKKQG
ncbi:MAG: DUF4432 family protein, partial [Lachnospiraceae bacterium]|nr:DUF4432 family protein [Lachnospiraceae bacterium]